MREADILKTLRMTGATMALPERSTTMHIRTSIIAAIAAFCLVLGAGPVVRAQSAGPTADRAAEEKKIEAEMAGCRKSIDELNRKYAASTGDMRRELQKTVDELNRQYAEAGERLQALRKATNERWDDVNRSMQSSLNTLRKSLENAQGKESTEKK